MWFLVRIDQHLESSRSSSSKQDVYLVSQISHTTTFFLTRSYDVYQGLICISSTCVLASQNMILILYHNPVIKLHFPDEIIWFLVEIDQQTENSWSSLSQHDFKRVKIDLSRNSIFKIVFDETAFPLR